MSVHYLKKKGAARKAGLPSLSSPAFGRLTSAKRSVARPYGGVLGHEEVRERYNHYFTFPIVSNILL